MNKILSKLSQAFILFLPASIWFFKFMHAKRKVHTKLGIRKNIWAFRKGFYPETIRLNGITKNNYHEFLTDRTYLRMHPINKGFSAILDNKFYLPYLLKDFPELVPVYYYYIEKGKIIKINSELNDGKGVEDLCIEKQKLAIKHCSSSLGKGFYKLEWKADNFFINYKQIGRSELNTFLKSLDKYLVTEYVVQNKYSAEINPDSVNTMVFNIIKDMDKNEFFIINAFHRFGLEGGCVDNTGSERGGIAAFIDISTGKIKNIGVYKEKDNLEKVIKVNVHPHSLKQIAGVTIPYWEETVEKILFIMNKLCFLKYVGLDIVITNNGFKILEINSLPNLLGLQMEGGILKDKRIKLFFNLNC